MLAGNLNWTILSVYSSQGATFRFLFDLYGFNHTINNLFHKLINTSRIHVVIVYLTIIRGNNITLLRRSSILEAILLTSDALLGFNLAMFNSCVLHLNEPARRGALTCIRELFLCLVIKLVLKHLELAASSFLRPFHFLHLLPHIFDIKVQIVFLCLQIETSVIAT